MATIICKNCKGINDSRRVWCSFCNTQMRTSYATTTDMNVLWVKWFFAIGIGLFCLFFFFLVSLSAWYVPAGV